MLDTHCHLDVEAFAGDRSEVLDRAAAAGVTGIVVPALMPATWAALLQWPAGHAGVRGDGTAATLALGCGLGIHPQLVSGLPAQDRLTTDELHDRIALAQQRPGALIPVVALGETGLDGGSAEMDAQVELLRAHVRVARALRLPVIIHVLRAHHLAPRVLREEKVWECGGVMHSYSGGEDLLPTYLELGLHISLAGPVTYERAHKPRRVAQAVPLDRLLLETDAPDQTPAPRRHGRNEPGFLPYVAAAIAQARGVSQADLVAATTANALRLFLALTPMPIPTRTPLRPPNG